MDLNLFTLIITDGFSNVAENIYCFREFFMSDKNTGNCYKAKSDYFIVAETEYDGYNQPVVTRIIHSYRTEDQAMKAHPSLAETV